MVVATSYEDEKTLRGVYPDFDSTCDALRSFGENSSAIIFGYNVDATRLNETLPKEIARSKKGSNRNKSKSKSRKGMTKFHRICWNFPCTAIGSGQDGQNDAMEQNKELVRKFVANALPYLDEDFREIHMAHKTKPSYNQWGLEKVALEGIEHLQEVQSKKKKFRKKFEFKGRIAFDKCTLPPYTPRKALDRKSFPCHDACIFVFGWKSGDDSDDDTLSSSINHSTIPQANHSTMTQSCSGDTLDKMPEPSSVISVAENMIERVRSTHLRNAEMRAAERQNKKHVGGRNKRRKKH